jgi:hypothetical protein
MRPPPPLTGKRRSGRTGMAGLPPSRPN